MMLQLRMTLVAIGLISATTWTLDYAFAQPTYIPTPAAVNQYPRSRGLDSNGRATDVDSRSIDQYGFYTNDYGRQAGGYGVPGHFHGNGYAPGGYYPGNYYPGSYSGLGYSNSLGYSVGLSGYSGGYATNPAQERLGVAGANMISPPRTIITGGVYPSRTVMNNATRGGVLEYTHNGNGYVYDAGSSYQTVISSGPSIFPQISVVSPSQPPVLIEAQKNVSSQAGTGKSSWVSKVSNVGEIKLMFPKGASAPLSYMLNGTVFSIKPGYVQTFSADRIWTIEFLRSGNGSQVMRYELQAGTYLFDADETGWDLKVPTVAAATQTPAQLPSPPVPAPIPSPDL